MPRGNPNPSPRTRFKKGQTGNPGGKNKDQVAIERRNAEAAMRVRERLLKAAEAKLAKMSDDEALGLVEAGMLKLLKDAEDRGLGAPVQDHKSSDGTMSPAGGSALDRINSRLDGLAKSSAKGEGS